jgi:hypothetical protein
MRLPQARSRIPRIHPYYKRSKNGPKESRYDSELAEARKRYGNIKVSRIRQLLPMIY